jgi:inorganic triphosphatase YgiF
MPTEVEARFRAETTEPLDDLATRPRLGPASLGAPRTVDETDRYLDTDDGRLEAQLWACRLRSRPGSVRISLKGPARGVSPDWLHRRPEVEGPASDALQTGTWPPSAARDLLDALRDGMPLRELLRLRQRRTERRVAIDDGREIGTLSLDRVRMACGEVDLGWLFVVELELDHAPDGGGSADENWPEDEAGLASLASELARVPGLVPEPRTKLEHALARLALRR